jgi:hypothetical protein
MLKHIALISCLFFCFVSSSQAEKKKSVTRKRPTLGWVEKTLVMPGSLKLHAKLDTGHLGTAIYARDIQRFKKNKESWARFTLKDRYGKEETLERKILRSVTLKGSSKKTRTEYVVELGICLGGQYFEDEVSLSDRGSFMQELRLGRQSLEGYFVVDPALTYTTKPDCESDPSS